MIKQAGILDPVKENLSTDVWGPDGKIKPIVKSQILRMVNELLGDNYFYLYVIGSITGHQYSNTSDIDVNAIVPEQIITDELHVKRKNLNGRLLKGTSHPINIFIQPGEKDKPINWQDANFGIYNLIEDRWEVSPLDPKSIRSPQDRYKLELYTAKLILNEFKRLVENYEKDKNDLKILLYAPSTWENKWKLKKKLKELIEAKRKVKEFSKEWDNQRKFEYSWGWGAPRVNYRNIVYKLLENSKYGYYFELFKEQR